MNEKHPINEVVTFDVIDLDLIVASLTNPRKHFDADKLRELSDSIKASGVHQPVLVRPLPGERVPDTGLMAKAQKSRMPTYELVAGERRFRACKMAGFAGIPAMIKSLTDDQVLEIQIVENLQRDDLTELEEAEGYQALCDATGIDKSQIGERIGRSRSYVYSRLKLLDLCNDGRNAMREGALDASKALLIARIPDEKLQIRALKEFTEKDGLGDDRVSYRGAMEWIKKNVMLKLSDARFKITDAALVEAAGSCEGCSKRTDANPDLFADINAPGICIDPVCYHNKENAHVERLVEQQRKKGFEVIEGKEAKEIMPHEFASSYLKGFQDIDVTLRGSDENESSYRAMLTKEEKKLVKVLVNPYTQELVHIVPDDVAQAVEGRVAAANPNDDDLEDNKFALEREKTRLQQEYEGSWRKAAINEIYPLVDDCISTFTPPLLRKLLELVLANDDIEGEIIERVLGEFKPEDVYDFDQRAQAVGMLPDTSLGHAIVKTLLLSESKPGFVWSAQDARQLDVRTPVIDALSTQCGIELHSIQARVQEEMKGQLSPPEKPDQGGTKHKRSKSKKLTAQEAQKEIAKALQGGATPDAIPGDGADVDGGDHETWPYPGSTSSEPNVEEQQS